MYHYLLNLKKSNTDKAIEKEEIKILKASVIIKNWLTVSKITYQPKPKLIPDGLRV